MCIGWPMQVRAVEPGHARCLGRDGERRVRTGLVGAVAPGDWLLVHLDSARARLTPARAAEIDATLRLVESALAGESLAGESLAGEAVAGEAATGEAVAAAFALPSATSVASLRALTGQPAVAAAEESDEPTVPRREGAGK